MRWIRLLGCLTLLGATMANGKEDAAVTAMMQEALLAPSPASLRVTLGALRVNLDLNDPGAMFTYVHGARFLIQHALSLAQEDERLADEYRAAIVPATYNLAADTWSGWEDAFPGANAYRSFGLESARLNIRLREELGQDASAQSRGHWVLGIQLIAAGQFEAAAESFTRVRDLSGDSRPGELMAQGWIHVANILQGEQEEDQLEAVKTELSGMGDDGAFLAGQYDPALVRFLSAGD